MAPTTNKNRDVVEIISRHSHGVCFWEVNSVVLVREKKACEGQEVLSSHVTAVFPCYSCVSVLQLCFHVTAWLLWCYGVMAVLPPCK